MTAEILSDWKLRKLEQDRAVYERWASAIAEEPTRSRAKLAEVVMREFGMATTSTLYRTLKREEARRGVGRKDSKLLTSPSAKASLAMERQKGRRG